MLATATCARCEPTSSRRATCSRGRTRRTDRAAAGPGARRPPSTRTSRLQQNDELGATLKTASKFGVLMDNRKSQRVLTLKLADQDAPT
jgi:hypothetical protein